MAEQAHVTELLPAYTLGCLDPGEAAQVSNHVQTCAACRSELHDYEEVAYKLSQSVPQVIPPAALKMKLMARIDPSNERKPQVVSSLIARWRSAFRAMPRLVNVYMLASLIFILVLGASNIFLWRQLERIQSTTQSSMQIVRLQGTEYAPDARAMIVISKDGFYGTLVVDKLPPLDPGKEYQLWLISDGKRTSGAIFSVGSEGYQSVEVSSQNSLISYDSFGVTVEPTGGSPGPTGEKVLGGGF